MIFDNCLNLEDASHPPLSSQPVVVFDEYVGGDIHHFKLTNLDAYTLNVLDIAVDGVGLDLPTEVNVHGAAWSYGLNADGFYTHQAGAELEFSVNATTTGKRVTICLGAQSQGKFARLQVMPNSLLVKGNLVAGGGLFGLCVELTGTTPYIDFKNSGTEDNDMRIIMPSTADKLQVQRYAQGTGVMEHI